MKVLEATYDDDTKDQFVAFTVNGKNTTATELLENGYDVKFEAFHGKNNTAFAEGKFFENSTTGELSASVGADVEEAIVDADILAGEEVKVRITLTKGSDVITSELGTIIIKNTDLAAGGISDYTLERTIGDGGDESKIEVENGILVVGDEATFTEIKVKTDGNEETIKEKFTVKSSNEAVVSVTDGTEIKAHSPGKATLTITYGGVSKTVSIEVKNEARELDKVVVEDVDTGKRINSINAAEYNGTTKLTTKVKVIALDQYGDEILKEDGQAIQVKPVIGNTDIIEITAPAGNITVGTEIIIKGLKEGRSTITFQDAEGYALPKSSVFNVNVSKADTVAKRSLDIVEITKAKIDDNSGENGLSGEASDYSKDTTLDTEDDKYLVIQLNQFTQNNVKLGAQKLYLTGNDKNVDVNQSKADVIEEPKVISIDGGENNALLIEAGKAGTATITVTDEKNKKHSIKLTIVEEGYKIKSVSFKTIPEVTYTTKLNYKTALNVTEGSNDPRVNGITLTKASSQPVRIGIKADKKGLIYLDKNADGEFNGDDTVLGRLQMDITTGTVGGKVAGAEVDIVEGLTTAENEEGTLLFSIYDKAEDGKIIASTSTKVDY